MTTRATIRVGDRLIGDGQPCFVIGEIGINHNGDLDVATGKGNRTHAVFT